MKILGKLLSEREGISLFDLSDNLHISESTVTSDINSNLKRLLNDNQLKCVSHNYILKIEGSEDMKRKLIGYIATHNNHMDYFSSSETLNQLYPDLDLAKFRSVLEKQLFESNLFINSYALNNLILHITIILTRLHYGDSLPSAPEIPAAIFDKYPQASAIYAFAEKVKDYCKELTGKEMPQNDYHQILILTAINAGNNTPEQMTLDQISAYVDPDLLNNIIQILLKTHERYNLPEPDNEFIIQFVLHVNNLYKRCKYNISYPNPLMSQIKREYAAIYDIAIYFCMKLSEAYDLTISEDEIAFIAFHFGSWLENTVYNSEKIPFILVSEQYYGFSSSPLHRLHVNFGDRLHHVATLTYREYQKMNYPCDLIISTEYHDFQFPHVVFINPFLKNNDIDHVSQEINMINEEKEQREIISHLKEMMSPALFFRNIMVNDAKEAITFLGTKCISKQLISKEFLKDVIHREELSSTALTDYLAIPHSVSLDANHSFIAIIYNDRTISWDIHHVNFVLLIGIEHGKMKQFRNVLDLLVNVFSSTENIKKILQSRTYTDFIEKITNL
jgi:transcriptional antiterminator